jgi:hypothetical protein
MKACDGVLWPDLHAPFHHRANVALAFKVLNYVKPEIFIQLGDFNDNNCASRHTKDPNREAVLKNEMQLPMALRAQLDEACRRNKTKRKIITLGNHDMWVEKRIDEESPWLNGSVTYDGLMGFSANNWEVVPYGDYITIGKMHFTHTWTERGQTAAQALKYVGGNNAFVHTHNASVAYGGDALGNTHVSANLGWLGDPEKAKYMFRIKKGRDWMGGCGLVHWTSAGDSHVQFIPFINGVAVVDRKEIRL